MLVPRDNDCATGTRRNQPSDRQAEQAATFDMAYFLHNTGPSSSRESSVERPVVSKKKGFTIFKKKRDIVTLGSSIERGNSLYGFVPPESVEQKMTLNGTYLYGFCEGNILIEFPLSGKRYLQIVASPQRVGSIDRTKLRK
jgi:hypothetical protein